MIIGDQAGDSGLHSSTLTEETTLAISEEDLGASSHAAVSDTLCLQIRDLPLLATGQQVPTGPAVIPLARVVRVLMHSRVG